MIKLPPGCTVTYSVWIDIKKMTSEVVEWYTLVGGNITEKSHYNHRGNMVTSEYVQYGKAKPCHYKQDGSGGVRLHFHGDDASVASMFLIKFLDIVDTHNLQQVMDQYDRDHA